MNFKSPRRLHVAAISEQFRIAARALNTLDSIPIEIVIHADTEGARPHEAGALDCWCGTTSEWIGQ